MTQSRIGSKGLHVAVIMDGNGRWAQRRGLPRSAGHRAGYHALKRVLKAAPDNNIRVLTIYALSSDNWQRPAREVSFLLRLLKERLHSQVRRCVENGIRVSVIGRRDRLPPDVLAEIEAAERATANCRDWRLRIAIDYSARDAILRAAQQIASFPDVSREAFTHLVADNDCTVTPDVDLLIRTGGEQRLSDFLLWECAYAELYFTDTLWPDFDAAGLAAAVQEYRRRARRFGRISNAPAVLEVAG